MNTRRHTPPKALGLGVAVLLLAVLAAGRDAATRGTLEWIELPTALGDPAVWTPAAGAVEIEEPAGVTRWRADGPPVAQLELELVPVGRVRGGTVRAYTRGGETGVRWLRGPEGQFHRLVPEA